jgi:plasmid stabilization system protein ParE
MDFKVLIAESAIADLKEIVEFVAQDDRKAANRLGNKLVDYALTPQRFPFHDQRRGIRKMPLPSFLVYYTCDEVAHVVNILHFWHGVRQSPQF